MLKSYTISSLRSLHELPNLDVCQFTLNSRTYPGRRRTVELLKSLSKTCTTKIIVHYDFIYIASRFALFSQRVKDDIINELCDILYYATFDNRILGVVMHTDFPIKKQVVQNPTVEELKKEYYSSLFDIKDPEFVLNNLDNILNINLTEFASALESALSLRQIKTHCKIYLENTTKIGPNNQGTFFSLVDFWNATKFPHIGLCLDSEHFYAVDGFFPWDITGIDAPLIYHLNTIPPEVTPKSKKDRHSLTTLFECSVNSIKQYVDFTDYLEGINVPYVREVKEKTMFRELEQLKQYGLYGE